MCELLQATDLASQPDIADVTEDWSFCGYVPFKLAMKDLDAEYVFKSVKPEG